MNLRRSPAQHDRPETESRAQAQADLPQPGPGHRLPTPRHAWAVELNALADDPAALPSRRALEQELAAPTFSDEERTALAWVLTAIADERPQLLLSRATARAVHRYADAAELDHYLVGRTMRCASHARAARDAGAAAALAARSPEVRTGDSAAVARAELARACAQRLGEDVHDLGSVEGLRGLVRDLLTATVVVPHLWSAPAYLVARSLRERLELTALGTLVDQVVHDEARHLTFGLTFVLTVIAEHEELQTTCFVEDVTTLLVDSVVLEGRHLRETWPAGTLGIEPARLTAYVEHLADRRLEDLGLEAHFRPPVAASWA